jgi:hypothetical protein
MSGSAGAFLWQDGGPVEMWSRDPAGWQWAAAHLFFQCVMTWRRLPWARGSGCRSFSSSLCFTSAKYVSKVPDPWSSHSLRLCLSHHFESSCLLHSYSSIPSRDKRLRRQNSKTEKQKPNNAHNDFYVSENMFRTSMLTWIPQEIKIIIYINCKIILIPKD